MSMREEQELAHLKSIPRLGLMAFEGRFPVLLAQAAAELHIPVTVFGVQGLTPPEIEKIVDRVHWMQLGQFGKFIEQAHEENIRHVVMAGRVQHNAIWKYRGFDLRSLGVLRRLINRKADTVLGAVVEELAREHIEVIDSTMLLRSCMPHKGLMTPGRPITPTEMKDIEFGLPIARQIAGMDIGQTIVVKDLAVVAVESLEGTDETIARAGHITGGGVVVVKVSKPKQDKRFDYPVVGPGTIKALRAAGGGVLAMMAGHALFFDQEEALALASEAKIGVIAM